MFEETNNINTVGLLFGVLMAILTWSLARRRAWIPLLITTCYMPLGQQVKIGFLHFPILRVLLLVGVCRILIRKETRGLEFTSADKLFAWWAAATLIMGTFTQFTFDRFITRSGEVYTAVGAYYLFRCWIRDTDEATEVLRFLGWAILPLAVFMLFERFTGRNVFAAFGGVAAFSELREGGVRCQGPFLHPILAGTYGATLCPIFVGLWRQGREARAPAAIGFLGGVIVALAAHSSGSLLALISAILGLVAWWIRDYMRYLRWGSLAAFGLLALIMNAPVWYIIARVSELAGGSGWHRSYVIEQAVKHFDEWWLVGTAYTAHWGQALVVDQNNMDITNQFVAEGVNGGLTKLILFVAIIVQGFKAVGRWAHTSAATLPVRFLVWSFGVSLFAHCVSFISISYFDQIIVMWFWLLAILSMLAAGPETLEGLVGGVPSDSEQEMEPAPVLARQYGQPVKICLEGEALLAPLLL